MSQSPLQRWFWFIRSAVEASDVDLGDVAHSCPSASVRTREAAELLEKLWQRILKFHKLAKKHDSPIRIDWSSPPQAGQIAWLKRGSLKRSSVNPEWRVVNPSLSRSLQLLKLSLKQLEAAVVAVPLPPSERKMTHDIALDLARYAQAVTAVERATK